MRRADWRLAICACLLLALACGALSAAAEGGADYWTTWLDGHYHRRADCAECQPGAVRVAAATAEAFGQTPCRTCASEVWLPDVTAVPDLTADGLDDFGGEAPPAAESFSAANYNAFEDTACWPEEFIPLRRLEGSYEQMSFPALAGDWIYYEKLTFDDTDEDFGFGPTPRERTLCRCRAADLSGEQVLLADGQVPGNRSGIRDAGDGVLLWYSDFALGVTTVRFEKLDYEGGPLWPFAEVQLKGMVYVYDAVVVGRALYFSWDDSILDLSHEGATGRFTYIVGEIWRLSLEDGQAERIFNEDRLIYDLSFAYGRLYFVDHDDNGWYCCALDPADGKRRELRDVDSGSYMVLNHRLYCRDAGKRRTVSMKLDGSDVKTVSKDTFDFRQAWKGHVLASVVDDNGMPRDSFAWYPKKASAPSFEPDSAKKTRITEEDFMLGGYFYEHRDGAVSRVFDKVGGSIAVVGAP